MKANSLAKNDPKLIQVTSNSEPVLKCSAAVSVPTQSAQSYTCETFNNVESNSDSFYFLVQGIVQMSFFRLTTLSSLLFFSDPPKILSNLDENIRLKKGVRKTITCSVGGSPNDLQIYWTDGQSIISNNSELNLDTGNAQYNQKNFKCIAKNTYGKDSQLVTVQIIGEISTRKYFEGNTLINFLVHY